MSNIRFNPWIGSRYFSHGYLGKRIMILGLSFYCDECYDQCGSDDPNFLSEGCKNMFITTIQKRIDGVNKKQSFHQKIVNLFSYIDEEIGQNEERFWNSVSFYNYIQEAVSENPRISPRGNLWEKYFDAFIEAVDLLEPNFILILGQELWGNLPGCAGDELWPLAEILSFNNQEMQTWYFKNGNKLIQTLTINHPSGGLSYERFYPFIRKAISIS